MKSRPKTAAALLAVLMVVLLAAALPAPAYAWDWSTVTVDGDGHDDGEYSSIALDSRNRPHISYFDATDGDLRYMPGGTAQAGKTRRQMVIASRALSAHTPL